MQRKLIGLALLAMAACEPYATSIPTTDRAQLVPVASMPESCRHQATVEYAQLLQNTSASPAVQQANGTYSVRGTYAAYNGTRFFECQFTSNGNLIGIYRP
ncbi:MAG: hypothetical protein AAGH83_09760 [Pseudomonadota bacterium]